MSLILDALKKSEQERRRERGPDLQTIHQASPSGTRAPRNYGAWIAALVAVNVLMVGGWWWTQRAPRVAAEAEPVSRPVAAGSPASASVVTSPNGSATPAPPTSRETAVVEPPKPAPPANTVDDAQFTRIEPRVRSPLSAATPVEEFTDLSPDVRSSLPAMTFSFHVYSADPRNRTIIINNQRLREGEDVSAGVTLESITEDGVILAMDHRRVHINVLTGW